MRYAAIVLLGALLVFIAWLLWPADDCLEHARSSAVPMAPKDCIRRK